LLNLTLLYYSEDFCGNLCGTLRSQKAIFPCGKPQGFLAKKGTLKPTLAAVPADVLLAPNHFNNHPFLMEF